MGFLLVFLILSGYCRGIHSGLEPSLRAYTDVHGILARGKSFASPLEIRLKITTFLRTPQLFRHNFYPKNSF